MTTIVPVTEINNAIARTFKTTAGIPFVKTFDEMPEGVFDLPMLLVYWTAANEDARSRETDRSAGFGDVRVGEDTFYADLYAKQRANLDEDLGAAIKYVDQMRTVLYQQKANYFGMEQIQAMRWSARLAVFVHSSATYSGVRFTIITRVF